MNIVQVTMLNMLKKLFSLFSFYNLTKIYTVQKPNLVCYRWGCHTSFTAKKIIVVFLMIT